MTQGVRARVEFVADVARRALTLLVVTVYALTLGAPSLHLILERHAVCLEHGEVAHVDVAPQSGEATLVADGATVTAQGDEDGHGHCAIPQCASAHAAPRASLMRVDVEGPRVVVDAHARDAARPIASLRFAPKTSPPAA